MNTPQSIVTNEDCMILMSRYPDNYFDLAVVDPPYGLGTKLTRGGGTHLKFKDDKTIDRWDNVPTPEYFHELFRISQNQIIWGGNYFTLPVYRCPIVWDKMQPVPNFSAFELAWSSFDQPSKIFQQRQAGFIGEAKIHPTQKPITLYDWIFKNYAKPGQKVLDTHLGSGSSRIAAHKAGLDFTACELDKDYFDAQEKRFAKYMGLDGMFNETDFV